MDRPDLAIDMRMRLGDWFKVEKLIKEKASGAYKRERGRERKPSPSFS